MCVHVEIYLHDKDMSVAPHVIYDSNLGFPFNEYCYAPTIDYALHVHHVSGPG